MIHVGVDGVAVRFFWTGFLHVFLLMVSCLRPRFQAPQARGGPGTSEAMCHCATEELEDERLGAEDAGENNS